MDIAALMTIMAQRNGLGTVEPDADRCYHFSVDADMPVSVEPLSGGPGFLLVGRLASVPRNDRERTLTTMLSLNLLDRRWSGTYLAIDIETDTIVLCRRYDGDASYDEFERELERFIDRMETMRNKLLHQGSKPAETVRFDLSDTHFIRV